MASAAVQCPECAAQGIAREMRSQGFPSHYAMKHPDAKFPGFEAIVKMEAVVKVTPPAAPPAAPPAIGPAVEEAMTSALEQPAPGGEDGAEPEEDEPEGDVTAEIPPTAPTPAVARQPATTTKKKEKEPPETPPAEAGRPVAVREGRRSIAESLFFGQVKAVTINEWGWRTDLSDGKWLDMYFYNTMLDYGIRLFGYDKADDPESLRLINAKAEKMAAEFIQSRSGKISAEVEARAQELVAEITTEQIQAAAMTIVRERLGSDGQ